jgi:hypothetical protein
MKLLASRWCANRPAGAYHPGYSDGPSLDAKPYPERPSIRELRKTHRSHGFVVFDPYGACNPCDPTYTSSRNDASYSHSFWTRGSGQEGPGNRFLEELRSDYPKDDLRAFIGAPARYFGSDAMGVARQTAKAYDELSASLAIGVRWIIDTGGYLLSRCADNPIVNILNNPTLCAAIDVEGWGAGVPIWPGNVWLGRREIAELPAISACVGMYSQGPKQNQLADFDWALERRVQTAILDADAFTPEEWEACMRRVEAA